MRRDAIAYGAWRAAAKGAGVTGRYRLFDGGLAAHLNMGRLDARPTLQRHILRRQTAIGPATGRQRRKDRGLAPEPGTAHPLAVWRRLWSLQRLQQAKEIAVDGRDAIHRLRALAIQRLQFSDQALELPQGGAQRSLRIGILR